MLLLTISVLCLGFAVVFIVINVPVLEWQGRFILNSFCVKLCVSWVMGNEPLSLCSPLFTVPLHPYTYLKKCHLCISSMVLSNFIANHITLHNPFTDQDEYYLPMGDTHAYFLSPQVTGE